MTSWKNPWYEVIEIDDFTAQASKYLGSVRGWDEIKEFIDQYLARNPKVGRKIPNANLYGLSLLTNPPLTIYYSVDDIKKQIMNVNRRERCK
jgi:hypothetical protein